MSKKNKRFPEYDLHPHRPKSFKIIDVRNCLAEQLGEGRRRQTFQCTVATDLVIKKGKGQHGRRANLREYWLWMSLEPEHRPLFCAVWQIWNKGEYILQPKMDALTDRAKTMIYSLIDEMPEILKSKLCKLHIWGYDSVYQIPRILDYEHVELKDLRDWMPLSVYC